MGALAMSYGKVAGKTVIVSSMIGTMFASKLVHNSIIGSGTQPVTMCAEYKAAEIQRSLAKPCQSVEGKTMMQNPTFACAVDWETGRAVNKFMYKPGQDITIVGGEAE